MRRLRNIVLILIVIILLLAGAATGYALTTVRRVLPQLDGTLALPGLDGKVEVYRDASGIPQIYATTAHDLFFAQGVVHAQDRWWQMEFNRHTALGRISELTGSNDFALKADTLIRTMGWNRAAQADLDVLTPESKAALDSYSAGVNAYIAGKSGPDLAVEYSLLGVRGINIPIENWQPLHSVAWTLAMAYDLSGNMDQELELATLYQRLDKDMVDKYYAPPYPFDQRLTILNAEDLPLQPGSATTVRNVPAVAPGTDLSDIQTALVGGISPDLGLSIGKGSGIGSNNWVISGKHTQSGKPLLANDPHLGIQMPSIWYEVGLHCTQISAACPYDVMGFSFPGAPGIIIGHNQRIAWGLTNVGPDVQDLYIIKVDPADDTKYEVDGKTLDMQVITETIRFGDKTPQKDLRVRVTRFGPIVTDSPSYANQYAKPLALRWTATSEKDDVLGAVLGVNRATDWASFREALKGFAVPAQNFIYADVDGNIGYQTPGLIPIRAKDHSGNTPVDGSTTQYDWKGYIPFDNLPRIYNPPRGYIVTANQAVVPPEYYTQLADAIGDKFGNDSNYTISTFWSYGYRSQRINDLVKATDKHSVDSIKAIQADNYNGSAAELLPAVLKLDFGSDVPKEVIDWMGQWDYQNRMDSGQAALFEAFWTQIVHKVWGSKVNYTPSGGTNLMWGTHLLLDAPDSAWWDDVTTSKKETRDDTLRSAFVDAYKSLAAQLGNDTKTWKWGTIHTATFVSNPLGASGINVIENFVNGGPVAVSGGSEIVNASGWSAADAYNTQSISSMRMIVDLSDFNNSQWIQSTGESGHPASPHYRDFIEKWRTMQYDAMLWAPESVQKAAVSTLILQPK